MSRFERLLLGVRPAPLAELIATTFGVNKRRLVSTKFGRFFIDPVSDLGFRIEAEEYEPEMHSVLGRFLSPGGTFIDLGANEGYFTVLASKIVGPKGSVIAVEPQSRLQDVIQTNLAANECFNVRVTKCVVAGKTGTMSMFISSSTNPGSSSLFRPNKYPSPTQKIQSYTLEDFLAKAGVESCDLMKVDIEGAEYDVFMAAGDVLKRGVIKNIAVEFHPQILARQGLLPETLHQHIMAAGYKSNAELGPTVYSR